MLYYLNAYCLNFYVFKDREGQMNSQEYKIKLVHSFLVPDIKTKSIKTNQALAPGWLTFMFNNGVRCFLITFVPQHIFYYGMSRCNYLEQSCKYINSFTNKWTIVCFVLGTPCLEPRSQSGVKPMRIFLTIFMEPPFTAVELMMERKQ